MRESKRKVKKKHDKAEAAWFLSCGAEISRDLEGKGPLCSRPAVGRRVLRASFKSTPNSCHRFLVCGIIAFSVVVSRPGYLPIPSWVSS